jgi:hypothetical protein
MATNQSQIRLFLERRGSPSNDTDIKAFLNKRPDGVAFDETTKKVCLLEFTRAMDAREDWEERKDLEKSKRYSLILAFINDQAQGSSRWEATD